MDGFDRNLDGYYDVANQLPHYLRLRATGLVGECDVPQLLLALADRDVSWIGTDPDRFR